MTEITAILPAYNEEVSIGSVVLQTKKYADRIIVVDDGSSDRTAEVAEMAGAEVIRHPQNRGKGAALKTGFEALNGTGVVVTIDTDGQHEIDEIAAKQKQAGGKVIAPQTCLLYTSPSPRDRTRSRMPAYA